MKRAILVAVIIAVAGVIAFKLTRKTSDPRTGPATSATAGAEGKPILYLFHDQTDQDADCRRIYAYADQAERELAGKCEVRRPVVKQEAGLVQQYQIRVLPTILLVSSGGEVQERFEGEDKATAGRIEQALARLKESAQ